MKGRLLFVTSTVIIQSNKTDVESTIMILRPTPIHRYYSISFVAWALLWKTNMNIQLFINKKMYIISIIHGNSWTRITLSDNKTFWQERFTRMWCNPSWVVFQMKDVQSASTPWVNSVLLYVRAEVFHDVSLMYLKCSGSMCLMYEPLRT